MPAYDQTFFDNHHARAVASARVVVPMLLELVGPRSVIDVGCGDGAWLSVFAELGIADFQGIDGPWVQQDRLAIPRERFTQADLTRPFPPSAPSPLAGRFDLALSLEVAEHLPESAAAGFVGSLVALAPVVVFSAAIPGQGGTDHVNEQWPDSWAERFAAHGYACVDCLRMRLWDNPAVAWWYAQNTLVFVERAGLGSYPALQAAAGASPSPPRRLVHPGCLDASQRQLLEWPRIMREGPGALRRALGRTLRGKR